jgi:phosphoglycerate dehydrogenase-like enzyme
MVTALMSKNVYAEFEPRIQSMLKAAGVTVNFIHPPTNDSAWDIPGVDAAFLTLDIRHSAAGLQRFIDHISKPGFQLVHFPGSGVSQHKWLEPLMARGVRATTSTGANAESVATTALTGLLMLARRAPGWVDGQRAKEWRPWSEPEAPDDIAGKTVVIVGVGAIGGNLARYLKALGMQVIGVRRSGPKAGDVADSIVPPQQLATVLPECDWLFLTCPLTRETRHLINAEALARMKPSAYVMNVSRGEVVDEPALIAALKGGKIAGAYLDVFEKEPLPKDSPLWDMPNVVISPHIAALSRGNQWRATEIFINNLVKFSRGETLVNEQMGWAG